MSQFNQGDDTVSLQAIKLDRRQLLRAAAMSAGSLMIPLTLSGCASNVPKGSFDDSMRPNAWLEITPENRFYLTLDRVEMGQGTYTGMATILGEELDVSPDRFLLNFAPVGDDYKQPEYGLQITGGSSSVSSNWSRLRRAGAEGRAMLKEAAAKVWNVDVSSVQTDNGDCIHPRTQQRLSYGELVGIAQSISLKSEPELKTQDQFKYIGKQRVRLDAHAKTFGKAVFGIDIEKEDLLFAVISRPEILGGKVGSFNDAAARQSSGVVAIFEVPRGIAVVAKSYWQARKAQEKLEINWVPGEMGLLSSADISALYQQKLADEKGSSIRDDGEWDDAVEAAADVFEATYTAPFLAHATMEPMNCTAWITKGECHVWAPTQGPDIARALAVKESGLSHDDVHIHTTYIGGGFGRRLSQDYVAEAVSVARHVDKPVKVIWSREEDMTNDPYRPATQHQLSATFDAAGKLTGWKHKLAGPRIIDYFARDAVGAMVPTWVPQMMVNGMSKVAPGYAPDESPVEGAADLPYAIDAVEVRYVHADAGVPVSYWRSVGHSQNGFVVESFIDELAIKSKQDPAAFRRSLLSAHPRHLGVLDAVLAASQWGANKTTSTGEKIYQGVAFHKSFNTYVAQVIDISVSGNQFKVHRVYCATDCGLVVNPDVVQAQMEGGIIFALTAALYGEITLKDGRVQQSNFHDYKALRMDEVPEIIVEVLASNESPTGVGEPSVPPVAPALANAIYAATGKRLRSLPLRLDV